MRQDPVFQIADDQLDLGVVAMINVGDLERHRPVGEKAVVAPVRPQRELLGVAQAGAADDKAPVTVGHLRDLRLAPVGVVAHGNPGVLGDLGD